MRRALAVAVTAAAALVPGAAWAEPPVEPPRGSCNRGTMHAHETVPHETEGNHHAHSVIPHCEAQ